MADERNMHTEHWWNDTGREKPNGSIKPHHSDTLSTTEPTWAGLELNLGLHSESYKNGGSTDIETGIKIISAD